MFLNNSSIPAEVQAEVSLKIAPISPAYFLACSSDTCSLSNKSLLFAANPITIIYKKMNKNKINNKYFLLIFFGAYSFI